MFANTEVNLQGFNNAMNDIQKLNDKMKKICNIDTKYQLYEIDEMDKICADLPRGNLVKSLQTVQGLNIENEKENIRRQLNAQGNSVSDDELNEMAQVVVNIKASLNRKKEIDE